MPRNYAMVKLDYIGSCRASSSASLPGSSSTAPLSSW